CIFLGLLFMKEAMAPVKDYPQFVAMFHAFQADTYWGVLKCAAAGCVLTLIVQSSSVTIGITMVLASQGLINFHTAAALVLGENVGTTITAILASLGANNNARRAAYFHSLFNIVGVFYVTLLFQPFVRFIEWGLGTFFGLNDLSNLEKVSFGIAAVHSTFNIFNTLVFLGPCRLIAQFMENSVVTGILTKFKLLRKETKPPPEIEALLNIMTYSHNKEASYSYVQLIEIETRIKKVLNYMGRQMKMGMDRLGHCIENSEKNSPETDQIFEMEKNCDKIKAKVMTVLTSFVGSEEAATSIIQQRIFIYERLFDNMESASDYMAQVAKLRLRLLDNKTDLLDYQKQDLLKLNNQISEAFGRPLSVLENISRGSPQMAEEHEKSFAAVKDTIRAIRAAFWNESSKNTSEPMVNDAYSNMLSSYRKVRDHLRSAGNAIFGIDKD
ncbi:MAG: Na/Pi symporter, partial [Candidatus Fibromonas sp.]|nr:Na/Pi symporter [Candidatus Fibromonas sp.]